MTTDLAYSFPAIVDKACRVLILGSMPGRASIDAGQYYAHPRNAFWPIVGELYGASPELPYGQRCERLMHSGVAVWDVLRQCQRVGSLDASIVPSSEEPNDFVHFLARYPRIERIYFNGQKAEDAFRRHIRPRLAKSVLAGLVIQRLPSTSPAHASMSFDQKLQAWRAALA